MKTAYPFMCIVGLVLIISACKSTKNLAFRKPITTAKFERDEVKIFEKGMAGMLESERDSQKYQALHRYAPIGSFMSITNLINGKLVIVSIVGKLPTSTKKNIIVKLTKRAYDHINAKGNVPVEIYFEIEIPSSLTPPQKPRVIVNNNKASNDIFDLIRPGGALYGKKPKKKILLKGKAAILNLKDSTQFYAAHQNISIGSYIRVINTRNNGKSVVVKVIKKTPENKSKDVVIQLSKAAYRQIGLTEQNQVKIELEPAIKTGTIKNLKVYGKPGLSQQPDDVFDLIRPRKKIIKTAIKKTKEDAHKTIVFEQGMARLMSTKNHHKYQALHRTAPVNTYIKITNMRNGAIVIVKVIGKLPKNAPDNVIALITKQAYDQIWSKDQIPVEIEYDLKKKKK